MCQTGVRWAALKNLLFLQKNELCCENGTVFALSRKFLQKRKFMNYSKIERKKIASTLPDTVHISEKTKMTGKNVARKDFQTYNHKTSALKHPDLYN
jgi:hypothetical protein